MKILEILVFWTLFGFQNFKPEKAPNAMEIGRKIEFEARQSTSDPLKIKLFSNYLKFDRLVIEDFSVWTAMPDREINKSNKTTLFSSNRFNHAKSSTYQCLVPLLIVFFVFICFSYEKRRREKNHTFIMI